MTNPILRMLGSVCSNNSIIPHATCCFTVEWRTFNDQICALKIMYSHILKTTIFV